MRDIGFAGFAGLALVRGRAKCVSLRYLLNFGVGQIGPQRIEQVPQAVVALRRTGQFGEQSRGIVHATIILNSRA